MGAPSKRHQKQHTQRLTSDHTRALPDWPHKQNTQRVVSTSMRIHWDKNPFEINPHPHSSSYIVEVANPHSQSAYDSILPTDAPKVIKAQLQEIQTAHSRDTPGTHAQGIRENWPLDYTGHLLHKVTFM